MRVPLWLAWVLLGATIATAALLRQFHHRTPQAPGVSPAVGSALFAAILLLLLVTARERRQPGLAGTGVRLGSLTPLLLLLLCEKWISIAVYAPAFDALSSPLLGEKLADALFRALAGIVLIAFCLLVGWISAPTMRKVWRRTRPARWPPAALALALVVAGTYLLLGGLSALLGGGLRLALPKIDALLLWIVAGQSVLALAEELYYRGLLLCEMERLAPRLGLRRPAARRWLALVATSLLFGLEHLQLGPPWDRSLRELVFVLSLGLLFGILVIVSSNLHFAAGVHAWINWLLLGAAPTFVDATGQPALPAGTYIGVTLILAFSLTYGLRSWKRRPGYRQPLLES